MEKIKKYLGGKQEVATNKNKKMIKKALVIGVGVAAFVAALAFGDEIGDIVSEWLDPNNFDTDIASSPASEYLNTSIGEDMGVCGTDVVSEGSVGVDGFADKSKISFGGAIDNSSEINRITKEIERQTKEVEYYQREIRNFTEYTSGWYSNQCNNKLSDALSKLQELNRDLDGLK